MEEIFREIRVPVRECSADIVAFIAARLHELLESRNDYVVASLAVNRFSEAVVYFRSPVKAQKRRCSSPGLRSL